MDHVDHAGPGGGGGTFIWAADANHPLIVAGGGGGGTLFGLSEGGGQYYCCHGRSDEYGSKFSYEGVNTETCNPSSDTPGEGGKVFNSDGSYWSGGGAGWDDDGERYKSFAHGGVKPLASQNPGHGGERYSDGNPNEGGHGGFGGGGGGGSDNMGSGGGGGYSGGWGIGQF